MNTRVYVENLPPATTAGQLTNLFAAYGNVMDVNLTVDRDSQKSLGFGFVTMVTLEGARAAIQALHGKQMATRTLIVTEMHPPSLGTAGTGGMPKPAEQLHPLLPNLKKNRIIPTITGQAGGPAQ